MDKVRTQLPPNCPPSLVELAVQSAAYEVEDRPDAEAILGWIDDLYASWPEDECPEPPLPNFPDFPLPDVVRVYIETYGETLSRAWRYLCGITVLCLNVIRKHWPSHAVTPSHSRVSPPSWRVD
jgi:hypothetical protein